MLSRAPLPSTAMEGVHPTQRFLEMLADPAGPQLDLGAALISAHANHRLATRTVVEGLDELAEACAEPTLDGLRRLLFRDEGFRGNTERYYDPANSFLDRVLDRRTGIPITLSVVMLEVGRRVGVPLDGVAMPGHFLVRDRVLPEVFVDPFDQGRVLDQRGVKRKFDALMAGRLPFRADFLEPVSATDILARMLANLIGIYQRTGDLVGIGWAARLRTACPGIGASELVDLGALLTRTGQASTAASVYAQLIEVDPQRAEAHEANRVRALARLN